MKGSESSDQILPQTVLDDALIEREESLDGAATLLDVSISFRGSSSSRRSRRDRKRSPLIHRQRLNREREREWLNFRVSFSATSPKDSNSCVLLHPPFTFSLLLLPNPFSKLSVSRYRPSLKAPSAKEEPILFVLRVSLEA